MMKRKIGDKVKIKSDLEVGNYGEDTVVAEMLEYRGKETEIIDICLSNNEYLLDIDASEWFWTDEMFED